MSGFGRCGEWFAWQRHDGQHIIFTRYQNDALELWQLDLQTGKAVALTSHGDVNLEPRYSPDDRQIAFVSTADSGHFNLYVAAIAGDRLDAPRRLLLEHTSKVDRYYYAPTDHVINPSWTPDGQHLLFVSNREVAYGTGDIWSVAVNAPEDLKKILSEETAWRAQPQVAPDGRRVLFSSYHGRQWQQLWITTMLVFGLGLGVRMRDELGRWQAFLSSFCFLCPRPFPLSGKSTANLQSSSQLKGG